MPDQLLPADPSNLAGFEDSVLMFCAALSLLAAPRLVIYVGVRIAHRSERMLRVTVSVGSLCWTLATWSCAAGIAIAFGIADNMARAVGLWMHHPAHLGLLATIATSLTTVVFAAPRSPWRAMALRSTAVIWIAVLLRIADVAPPPSSWSLWMLAMVIAAWSACTALTVAGAIGPTTQHDHSR